MLKSLNVALELRWILTASLVLLVVALSIAPGRAQPGDSLFEWIVANTSTPVQKLSHVVVYALLAAMWLWTLESIKSYSARTLFAFTISAGLGAFLEWYQTLVPGRFGTLADLILDLAGVIIGLAAARLLL